MQVSTNYFFNMIQDRIKTPSKGDLNPYEHKRIRDLFNTFFTKFSQFGNCVSVKNHFTCTSNNESEGYLSINPDPQGFAVGVYKHGKDSAVRWLGHRIDCAPASYSDSNLEYSCNGRLPQTGTHSYKILQTTHGCEETYADPITGEYVKGSCDDGLQFADAFVSNSRFDEVSFFERAWSYTKVGAGITGTVYFGYKTFNEVRKFLVLEKIGARRAISAESMAEIETSKKRAMIYSIATFASLIFTTAAYYKDYTGIYQTNMGNAVRFV